MRRLIRQQGFGYAALNGANVANVSDTHPATIKTVVHRLRVLLGFIGVDGGIKQLQVVQKFRGA